MRQKAFLFGTLLNLAAASVFSQTAISLNDIWASRKLFPTYAEGFQWHQGGKQYLEMTDEGLAYFQTSTGLKQGVLVPKSLMAYQGKALEGSEFTVSESGQKVLMATHTEPVYRRSSKSEFYVIDLVTKKVQPIDNDPVLEQNAVLSPDGNFAAFMRGNNVFVTNLRTGTPKQITTDGKLNEVINGACDWVYEEEFEFAQAIYFSPDSKRVAWYRFDERQVPEYNLQYWQGSLYPRNYKYKYPKAGEKNSEVSVKIYELEGGKTTTADAGTGDQYIARVRWTGNPLVLSLIRLNRLQNKFEVLHCQASSGNCQAVYTETSKQYVEVNDNLSYQENSTDFVLTSERDGFRHIYSITKDGKNVRQLTKGKFEVQKVNGVDELKSMVYFTAFAPNGYQTAVYSVSLKGGKSNLLTPAIGMHDAEFSPDFGYFLDTYSTITQPPVFTLRDSKGKEIKVLEDNKDLKGRMAAMNLVQPEFLQVPAGDTLKLNAWMMRPRKIETGRRYPLLMFCYGGPGNTSVEDQWRGPDFFWYQMLVDQGYTVVCVDNRGTGGRGAAFRKSTYGRLGKLESDDQAAAARWFGQQPFIDPARIALWGWSFGGYLTALTLERYGDLFKAGMSVAPVTNWRYYDSIYTERYLGLPKDNTSGYDDNSPAKLASRMKSKYLLVHGTGDDNVHLQNAMELVNGLVASNVQFESFYYPDRHHGISGGKTRLHLYTLMTDFLKRNL